MILRRLLSAAFTLFAVVAVTPSWSDQVGFEPAELVSVHTTAPGNNADAKDVKVPNVLALWRDEAILNLFKAGLRVGDVREETSTSVADHHVISESPAAGTETSVGSKIDLVIARAPEVTVPDVVALTIDAAKVALAKVGLKVGQIEEKPSATVAAGLIISQRPPAGTKVREDRRARLVVSKGTSQDTVPNVIGATQAAATTAIVSAGLTVGTVTMQSSAKVAVGLVISESPTAGTPAPAGSAVSLIISSGVPKVLVPNVVGLAQAAASTAITGAGLVLGSVTTASSATVAAGLVIRESPAAGTSVAAKSAVNLVVSSGAALVVVPNVVGATRAAATAAITSAGLTLGTITTQSSTTVAAGLVISESPTAGTNVVSRSAVSLAVSSGASVTLTSISVAPGTSSLLLNATLQLDAVATYSDGSVKDVTNLVIWASSVPAVATITNAGVLNGVAAGGTQITAAIGNIQGAASVTIDSSSTGFTLIPDLTDSRLMSYTNADGSIATYFGLRDATGLPTQINSVLVSFPNQTTETVQLDSQSRPTLFTMSSGGQISLNWTSANSAILTAFSPDGTAQLTTTLSIPTSTSAATATKSAVIKRILQQPQASPATPGGANQVSVQVSNCGQPENGATVTFTKIGAFGFTMVPGTPAGGGSYTANLPSGLGTINLGQYGEAAASAFTSVCNGLTVAQAYSPTPVVLSTAVCLAISGTIAAAGSIPTLGLSIVEAGAIQTLCTAAGVGLATLQTACSVQSNLTGAQKFFSYFNQNPAFNIQATAQVPGTTGGTSTLQSIGGPGPYTVPPITLNCPAVGSVSVSPPILSLQEGATAPVAAEVFNVAGQLIESSVSNYQPNWIPSDIAEASDTKNAPATTATGAPIGPATATVTAGTVPTPQGDPALVTAEVAGVSGSTQVTVIGANNTYIGEALLVVNSTDMSSGCGTESSTSTSSSYNGPLTLLPSLPLFSLSGTLNGPWYPATVTGTGPNIEAGTSTYTSSISAAGVVQTVQNGTFSVGTPSGGTNTGTITSTETIVLTTGDYKYIRQVAGNFDFVGCIVTSTDTDTFTGTLPVSVSP